MKGMIFNEFLNYIEQALSYDMVDKIILQAHLKSDGAYTSIGTYDSAEFFALVSTLGEMTGQPKNKILIDYGEHLFAMLVNKYPQFVTEKESVFQFLPMVEQHIHMEVKKLYTDAELPTFQCTQLSSSEFVMIYTSLKPLADLAEGLIRGCIRFYHENIMLTRKDVALKRGFRSKFLLKKAA